MFWENVKLALEEMKTSKLRTALSLLGIIIGVGAVVAILNLGASVTSNITGSLDQGGADIITVYNTGNKRTQDIFNIQFADTIRTSTEGIESVSPLMQNSAVFRSKDKNLQKSFFCVESTYFETQRMVFSEGKGFTPKQNIDAEQLIVLGSKVASDLFPDGDAMGSKLTLILGDDGLMHSFSIIGVLEEKEQSFSMSYNDSVFIPLNVYSQKLINDKIVSSYVAKLKPGYDTIKVSDNLNKFLDSTVGSNNYQSFSSAIIANIATQVTGALSVFLAAIAGISLLVGGIGIMNIMLVSVAERTKEIGIRKALGANSSTIRGQFLVEAITLTLVGGLIGILFGIGLSYAIVNIAGWTLKLSLNSFLIAFGFSMFVGVFFGWYPAKQAASLDPIEALNYE